ncbi:polyketide cyclase dehydrase [Nannochloropsis oceanica]
MVTPLSHVLRRATAVLALSAFASLFFLTHDDGARQGARFPLISILGLAGASSTELIFLGAAAAPAPADMDSAAAVTAAAGGGGGGGKTTITKREKRQLEKKRKREEQEAKRNKEVEEGQWVESTSADGRITTAYLKQAGSKGTIGLRGQALVDHHISEVLTVFLNTSLSTEWVSYLDHAEELPTSQENTHIIYQFFDMPLPLSDREFLFERRVESDRKRKTVVAKYRSVEHASKPQRKNVVRGETHNTFWKFRVLNKRQTQIEVQSTLNPKLPINGWVVQMMQNTYQRASLLSMLDLVKKADPHPVFMQW